MKLATTLDRVVGREAWNEAILTATAPTPWGTFARGAPIGALCLSIAQQETQYRIVPHTPEVTLSPFEAWQQTYGTSGGTPDAYFMEVECSCHATLGRHPAFISPSVARCSRTEFVSCRHWKEDYSDATMCSECWPIPRTHVDIEFHRSPCACMYPCDSCRVILQELVITTDLEDLLDMGVPVRIVAQTPHQANPPSSDRTGAVEGPAPEDTPTDHTPRHRRQEGPEPTHNKTEKRIVQDGVMPVQRGGVVPVRP